MNSRHLTAHATHEPAHRPRLLDPDDRRAHQRHEVVHHSAWIGRRHASIWHEQPATLLNLSAGGLLLVSRCTPATRESVWICLDGTHRTDWVEGVVLAHRFLLTGQCELRVKFVEVCPYAFFDLAIYGDRARPCGDSEPDVPNAGPWT